MIIDSESLALGSPRIDSQPATSGSTTARAWADAVDRQGLDGAAASACGDFAFGLRRPDGKVQMAVDRFAMQTICWRADSDGLHFAERADQLAGPNPDLDPQALFDYLYFHMIPSPRTIFRGVRRLPPGRCLESRDGAIDERSWWTPRFEPASKADFAALRDEFRHLLRQAVRRQLDGSKGACFLSGGTDSSTVAGLIAELSGQPPATYSIGFEAEGYDEMSYARIAARRFGAEHHEYYVTPDDLVRSIGTVAASFDEPFGNSSAVPAYHCALNARGDGITKLLAGDGGDELFGGNSRYAKQKLFAWYQNVPSGLRSGLMEPFFGLEAVSRTPLLRKGSGYIRQAKTPMPDRLQDFNLVRRLGYDEVLEPAFLAQVDTADVDAQQRGVWGEAECRHEVDRQLAYDWRYTLAESDLPKVRGATSLAGVAVGYPMLDDDLLAFSLRLPTHYKVKGLTLRWFFKEALRGFLPDEIITKKKQGFGLPFGVWMVRHEALRQLATDSMRSFATRGIVRPAFVDNLLSRRLPEHPHYYGTMVWILMMAEQWMRVHAPDWKLPA